MTTPESVAMGTGMHCHLPPLSQLPKSQKEQACAAVGVADYLSPILFPFMGGGHGQSWVCLCVSLV